jgi:putative copper export protein
MRSEASRTSARTTGSWLGWPLVGAAGVVGALLVAAAALVYGGGRPQPTLPGLSDAGVGTQWALPMVRVLVDGAAVVTVGLLLTGAVLVPSTGERLSPMARWYVRAAGTVAVAWAAVAVVAAVFTVSDILGRPVTELGGPGQLLAVEQSRALLLEALLALALALASTVVRVRAGAVAFLVVAVAAALPPAFTGHAAEAGDHGTAVSSLVFHIAGVTLWVGGLVGLLTYVSRRPGYAGGHDRTVSPTARRQAVYEAAQRFSTIALVCWIVVAVSGAVNAWVRLPTLAALTGSDYGRLVLGKVLAIVALGVLGQLHRTRTLAALRRGHRGAFVRLATAEVVLMAVTIGLAVGLSRTPIS